MSWYRAIDSRIQQEFEGEEEEEDQDTHTHTHIHIMHIDIANDSNKNSIDHTNRTHNTQKRQRNNEDDEKDMFVVLDGNWQHDIVVCVYVLQWECIPILHNYQEGYTLMDAPRNEFQHWNWNKRNIEKLCLWPNIFSTNFSAHLN